MLFVAQAINGGLNIVVADRINITDSTDHDIITHAIADAAEFTCWDFPSHILVVICDRPKHEMTTKLVLIIMSECIVDGGEVTMTYYGGLKPIGDDEVVQRISELLLSQESKSLSI